VGDWIRTIDVDPILPWRPLESDPSCIRLIDEIVAASMQSCDEHHLDEHRQRAMAIVRELCNRTYEATYNLSNESNSS
jgi:hypothetical protein